MCNLSDHGSTTARLAASEPWLDFEIWKLGQWRFGGVAVKAWGLGEQTPSWRGAAAERIILWWIDWLVHAAENNNVMSCTYKIFFYAKHEWHGGLLDQKGPGRPWMDEGDWDGVGKRTHRHQHQLQFIRQ